MAKNSLESFVEGVRSAWGPLSTTVVAECQRHLERLLMTPVSEDWLAGLLRDLPASKELYRDPSHGFVLLAHAESTGLYRPPHDHGRAWVIYGIQSGTVEMGTFLRVDGPGPTPHLVKRNATPVRPGQVQVYLPGDIHDTRCTTGPALLFRFTERDLHKEDKQEHRVTRYPQQDEIHAAAMT